MRTELGKRKWIASGMLLGALLMSGIVAADAPAGAKAPAFSLPDWDGKTVRLDQFKGKTVVLEWHNPNCPFVVKHYSSANMPGLQSKYSKQVVWVAINSTNPSHGDYMPEAQLKTWMAQRKSQPAHYLVDKDGRVGKAYGAKTTPQMVIIDPSGVVKYHGAIDSIRSAQVEDIKLARKHVGAALEELATGKVVSVPSSTPYGCSVKY